MAAGDDIVITLSWPVQDDALSYATHLTSVPEGSQIFRDDVETNTRNVTCTEGYAYHQETIVITNTGSRTIRAYDFIAGQPLPAPSDMEVFNLGHCVTNRNFIMTLAGFSSSNPDVEDFDVNGEYLMKYQEAGAWLADPKLIYRYVGSPTNYDAMAHFAIACADGEYDISDLNLYFDANIPNPVTIAQTVATTGTNLVGNGTIQITLVPKP